MSNWVIGTGFVVSLSVALVVNVLRERRRLRPFYERGDWRAEWLARFPEVAENEVSEFLEMFVHAFCLRQGSEFAFRPDDRLIDVYRAIYPGPGMADGLEFETFVMSVERRYGVDLGALWREDVTLGEVFGWVRECDLVAK